MYIHAVELLELSGNGVENSSSYSGIAQYVVSVIAWNIPHAHPHGALPVDVYTKERLNKSIAPTHTDN